MLGVNVQAHMHGVGRVCALRLLKRLMGVVGRSLQLCHQSLVSGLQDFPRGMETTTLGDLCLSDTLYLLLLLNSLCLLQAPPDE